jgi:hypothetical protein
MVVYGMADGRLIELSCQNVAKQAGGELASSDGDRTTRNYVICNVTILSRIK